MKNILAAVVLSAGLIGSAHAASSFTVSGGTVVNPVTIAYLTGVGNDFTDLPANGYTMFCTSCTLTAGGSGTVAIYKVGSESSNFDSLWSGSTLLANETDIGGRHDYGPFPVGTLTSAGVATQAQIQAAINALIFKVDVVASGIVGSSNAAYGTAGFGIFWNPNDLSQVILAFDDHGGAPEDNHDDFLVRVAFVPEPATWGLMILGFAGLAMARRRSLVRA